MIFDMTKRVSGGGGDNLDGTLTTYTNNSITDWPPLRNLQTLVALAVTKVWPMRYAAALVSFCMPNAVAQDSSCFQGLTNLKYAVINKSGSSNYQGIFRACSALEKADISGNSISNAYFFYQCTALSVLVLRHTGIVTMGSSTINGTFVGSSLSSGGNGCTIYIPKSLYDHLGDGTSLDYKNATGWSAYDGYGTITWAKIEGSYYETHYADGTTIPT